MMKSLRATLQTFLAFSILVAHPGVSSARGDLGKDLPKLLELLYLTSLEPGLSGGDTPRFQVTVTKYTKATLKTLKSFEKQYPKTATSVPFCFKPSTDEKAKPLVRLNVENGVEREILSAFFPDIKKTGKPVMFLDLKAAGLTKKKAVMSLPNPKAVALQQLVGMVKRGKVQLKARLKNKPKRVEVNPTIATIKTNKGDLKLRVIDPKAKTAAVPNSVVFKTFTGKKIFEIPLSRFPRSKEVRKALTVFGAMRRTRTMTLKAGSAEDKEFILRFPSKALTLGRTAERLFGVVGLNERGEVITKPLAVSYDARVVFHQLIDGDCSFAVTPSVTTGASFAAKPFSLIYSDADEAPVNIFLFDPIKQVVGVTFDERTKPGASGIVVERLR